MVIKSLEITSGLHAVLSLKEIQVAVEDVPTGHRHVYSWQSILSTLEYLETLNSFAPTDKLILGTKVLEDMCRAPSDGTDNLPEEVISNLRSITHQMHLLNAQVNRRRYPPELCAWAAALHTESATVYR